MIPVSDHETPGFAEGPYHPIQDNQPLPPTEGAPLPPLKGEQPSHVTGSNVDVTAMLQRAHTSQ